jgi:hypothetical protein
VPANNPRGPWRLVIASRRGIHLLVLIVIAAGAALLGPGRQVSRLPAASGATAATPVWVLLMLFIAVALGAFLRPAMPELEAMSAGNPERAAMTMVAAAAASTGLVLAAAGAVDPGLPSGSMIRALTFWLSLTLIGRRVAPRGAWILPLAVAIVLLWFGFAASGPKPWAVPFRVDHSPAAWAATVAVGLLAAGVSHSGARPNGPIAVVQPGAASDCHCEHSVAHWYRKSYH